MKNIFLTSVLCFILTLAASGQTLKDKIKASPDAKQFETVYDKFKDQTVLGTHVMFRYPKAKISSLQCDLRAIFSGQEIGKTVDAFFLVCSPKYGGRSWKFLDDHGLIFLLDGSKLDLGEGTHDGKVYSGGVTEWVVYDLSRSQLQKLADAKNIEIQLGPYEGEIERDGQPRLKTMLDLTEK